MPWSKVGSIDITCQVFEHMIINPHTMGFRLTNLSEFPNNGVDGHTTYKKMCLIYRIHIVYDLISILYYYTLYNFKYIYILIYIYVFVLYCILYIYIYTCISSHSVSHCWPIPPRIPCSQLAQLVFHPRCSWVGHRGLSLSTLGRQWRACGLLLGTCGRAWLENVGFNTPGISMGH